MSSATPGDEVRGAVGGLAGADVEKYQFEVFELFPKQRALWRDGERLPLMPKPLETLVILVEHAGQTVSKDELLAQVWKGVAVEENNLTQSISTLRKALGEKRGENRYIVTDPGYGYRFVAPVSRIVEAPAAAPAPTVPEPASLIPASPASGVHAARRWGIAMLAALLAIGAATYWLNRHSVLASPPVRRSVAVLRIRDLSERSGAGVSREAWLQTALTEMLTSELAAGGKLRTVPADDVDRWRADLGPAAEHEREADLFRSAQRNLGADDLVVGSYLVTGVCPDCRVRVDLGLMNAGTGERFGTVIEDGSAADLTDLTSRLGRRLRAEFGITTQIAMSPRWPAASAMREYAEGLKALRGGDPVAARDQLTVAAEADPGNALIHSALAETWTALGYSARANDENRRAYDLSSSLDRLDRLGVEARYRAGLMQWDRAIEIYKTIFQLFPDSLDDGLNLARTQLRAGRAADLKSTLSLLRELPPPGGNDPRIDMTEAQAAGVMNDYPRTRNLAHRAAEEAHTRGALYMYARARLLEGGAMQNLADGKGLRAAIAVQEEARHVCEQIGDRDCVSKAWRITGNRLYGFGDFQAAQDAYSQGVTIARELGNKAELSNLLTGFAVVAEANREWGEAEKHLQEAIALKIETGFHAAEVQNELAELYIILGKSADAARTLELAYYDAQKASAHEDLGEIYLLQSELARSKGELDRARQLSTKAVTELRTTQNRYLLSAALVNASSIATQKGDLQAAESDLAGASGVTPELEGQLQSARAELWMAQGRFRDAAAEAGRSTALLDKVHSDQQAARAFLVSADALEMLHHDDQALKACREGEVRAQRIPNQLPVALARLCEWRVGGVTDGRPRIPENADPEIELAAEYATAMRARRAGDGKAKALFSELARTASARGYVTVAKRAQEMQQR